jgi:hypothetical protein
MLLIDKNNTFLLFGCLGYWFFFSLYIYHPTPKVVYEYPSPEKIKDITYQNKSNQCYKYHTSKVNCPLDSTKIIDITN